MALLTSLFTSLLVPCEDFMNEFNPGDRVVLIRNYAGLIGGTVIKTQLVGGTLPTLALHVIFDDGSTITAEASNFWLESEYNSNRPF